MFLLLLVGYLLWGFSCLVSEVLCKLRVRCRSRDQERKRLKQRESNGNRDGQREGVIGGGGKDDTIQSQHPNYATLLCIFVLLLLQY